MVATFSGGFHNVGPITLRIRGGVLSPGQAAKLRKHFCGMTDCHCGGPSRCLHLEAAERIATREWGWLYPTPR